MTDRPISYWPGDLAPISGVYRVTHLTGHRPPHDALMLRGEELPPCRVCKGAVSFAVINPTSHTTHDWDFAGPGGLVVRPGPADYSEFRSFRRYEVDLPVVVGEGRSKNALRCEGRTYDLGEGGIGATFESRLTAKKSVCVEINLPHLTEPLVLKARVRHIKGLRHGFQFTGMNDTSRLVLRQALRQRMTPG